MARWLCYYALFILMIPQPTRAVGEESSPDGKISPNDGDANKGKLLLDALFGGVANATDSEDGSPERLWLAKLYEKWQELTAKDPDMCVLHPQHSSIHEKVARILRSGSKLIEYELNFPAYDVNPLGVNMTENYKANVWQRVTSKHGRTLLTLAFNYDLLSMSMLQFGVERLSVSLLDYPAGCLGNLSEPNKIVATRVLLMNDFLVKVEDELWLEDDDHVCHHVIERGFLNYGRVTYQCCMKTLAHGAITCLEDELTDPWVTLLYGLLEGVRLIFFLFGPLLLQGWLARGDMRSSVPYVVHLDEEYTAHVTTNALGRQHGASIIPREVSVSSDRERLRIMPMKVPMEKLRRRLNEAHVHEKKSLTVSLERLHIIADHTKLMTQSDVPVGLLSFLTREVIYCRLLSQEPMRSCSLAGCLLGNWAGRFLFIRLPGCRMPAFLQELTWARVVRFLGILLLVVVVIPLPFHIRVVSYFYSEAEEMSRREDVLRGLGLQGPYIRSFWLGSRWPFGITVVYIIYFVAVVLLGLIRQTVYKAKKFDDIFQDCITDLREISYTAIIRMLLAHLLLPLEKFGVILGPIIAIPYYVLMLPIAVCVSIFYGVPTFYMIGRLLVNFRPTAILIDCQDIGKKKGKRRGRDTHMKTNVTISSRPGLIKRLTSDGNSDYDSRSDNTDDTDDEEPWKTRNITLSDGANTCETMFFLEEISPDTREYPRLPETRVRRKIAQVVTGNKRTHCAKYLRKLMTFVVGLISVVLMLDMLLMYAEAMRFFLEVIVLTLMGVIVNADFALDYFMLFFWTLIYCNTCFKNVYESYAQLTGKIFSYLKGELQGKVADVTRVPERFQNFTAFKYFTHARIRELQQVSKKYQESDDENENVGESEVDEMEGCKDKLVVSKETNRAYWLINNLVLFISRDDVPMIPKKLFWTICNELRAPGCPGPMRHSIMQALKQLVYMVLFLMFVFIIIMSFDQVTNISASNQLMLTVISGFLPFIIRFVLMPKRPDVDLSEYSMKGKMEEILLAYKQKWPAYDLAGNIGDASEVSSASHNAGTAGAADDTMASYVTPLNMGAPPEVSNVQVPIKVDVCDLELDVPVYTPKYTISSFAFWDGPVERKSNPRSKRAEAVQDGPDAKATPLQDMPCV